MPAAVLIPAIASVIGGGVAAGAAVHGSNVVKKSNDAALRAQADAAAKAEAFTREENAHNEALQAERDKEDKRRYDIDQANVARQKAEDDFLKRQDLMQQNDRDQRRYAALKNLSELAGVAPPAAFRPRELPPSYAVPPMTDPRTVGLPGTASRPMGPNAQNGVPPGAQTLQSGSSDAGAWSPFQLPTVPMRRLYSAGRV